MVLASTHQAYVGEMWQKLSSLATWQPDVRLAVGDVVSASTGGVVTRETTLAGLGIPASRLSITRHIAAPVREHSGVALSMSGGAVVSPAGKARASFSKQSSFLVVTAQGWLDSADSATEARGIVEALDTRARWDPSWHLVTSVRRYPACTIVIAKTAGAEVEVSVDLSAAGAVAVDGIRAGASLNVNSDYVSHWAMNFDSTPLYQAIGIRRRVLRRRSVAHVEYLAGNVDVAALDEADDDTSEASRVVERSSPADLGLV